MFQFQVPLLPLLPTPQLLSNVIQLQAATDEVRLSRWTLTVSRVIANTTLTALPIRSTAADIGHQAFAVPATGAAMARGVSIELVQK